VDFYSSAASVLRLFEGANRRILRRTFLYFDDVADPQMTLFHRFAGELLAIDEFNGRNAEVKIDIWRGLRAGRIFQDSGWIDKMFIAHDLTAINRTQLQREPLQDFGLVR
jgi:hypothetical protein